MVKIYFWFLNFWLFLRKVNKSGSGIFQASFVTSQLWIVRDFQPMRRLESKIVLAGELCQELCRLRLRRLWIWRELKFAQWNLFSRHVSDVNFDGFMHKTTSKTYLNLTFNVLAGFHGEKYFKSWLIVGIFWCEFNMHFSEMDFVDILIMAESSPIPILKKIHWEKCLIS